MNDLEFIISQYLDGVLPEAERRSLEVRLEKDADARALLNEYRKLDGSLKSLRVSPVIRWDRLAAQISSAVADRDNLEFAISEYVGGSLDELGRSSLEIRLADDADARALLAEHQALNDSLKTLPAMQPTRWENFARHISEAIDRQQEPIVSYKLFNGRPSAKWALAASVLLAIGLTIGVYLRNPATAPHGTVAAIDAVALHSVIDVSGPVAETADHPVTEVRIGPASELASGATPYSDDLTSRPSRVIVASSASPQADASLLPY